MDLIRAATILAIDNRLHPEPGVAETFGLEFWCGKTKVFNPQDSIWPPCDEGPWSPMEYYFLPGYQDFCQQDVIH